MDSALTDDRVASRAAVRTLARGSDKREARHARIAPVCQETVLTNVGEHVLGLPPGR